MKRAPNSGILATAIAVGMLAFSGGTTGAAAASGAHLRFAGTQVLGNDAANGLGGFIDLDVPAGLAPDFKQHLVKLLHRDAHCI